jgi:hypothetical protein
MPRFFCCNDRERRASLLAQERKRPYYWGYNSPAKYNSAASAWFCMKIIAQMAHHGVGSDYIFFNGFLWFKLAAVSDLRAE